MADLPQIPFADPADLRKRWPDMPAGADDHAEVLLEDASQFMLDAYPACVTASENTRKRIVCGVVRRAMQNDELNMPGVAEANFATGPFSDTIKPLNPHGDFYLTEQEQRSLGLGRGRRQRAFQLNPLGGHHAQSQ